MFLILGLLLLWTTKQSLNEGEEKEEEGEEKQHTLPRLALEKKEAIHCS